MPGLILYGRRWSIGADDFVYTGLCTCIPYIAWYVIFPFCFVIAGLRTMKYLSHCLGIVASFIILICPMEFDACTEILFQTNTSCLNCTCFYSLHF